jgi:hypothetical protein
MAQARTPQPKISTRNFGACQATSYNLRKKKKFMNVVHTYFFPTYTFIDSIKDVLLRVNDVILRKDKRV